jgi:arylsulfatase A-like enzyme
MITEMARLFSVYTILFLLAGLYTLPGCAPGDNRVNPPNVVIITLDTVRADHLGCYGYTVDTTPRLDAFANKATRYSHMVASSPWTVPTHASFFTGKFAFEHGAHGFKVNTPENNVNPLPSAQLTLAEVFWDEGYITGAFVANDAFLGPRWQLNQGFETYRVERTPCTELNKKVFAWLDVASKKPFLLFVNYIDTHRPYNARTVPGLLPRPVVHDNGTLLDSLYTFVMPGTNPVPAGLKQKVIDQYDTALRNLDAGIGDLIDRLGELGVYDNTVLIVTSDHGEFFGEHLLVEHSKDVYEEVLAVPLIVKYPGQTQGLVETTVVSATDLPHLVLSSFVGENWETQLRQFPDAPGTHEIISELYYTRTKDLFHPVWGHRFDRIRTAIYDGPFKYIFSSDGENELYNLELDRAEAVNLIGSDEATANRLATRLQNFFDTRGRSEEMVDQEPLSEEESRRLKSLGYIGD